MKKILTIVLLLIASIAYSQEADYYKIFYYADNSGTEYKVDGIMKIEGSKMEISYSGVFFDLYQHSDIKKQTIGNRLVYSWDAVNVFPDGDSKEVYVMMTNTDDNSALKLRIYIDSYSFLELYYSPINK